MHVLGRARGNDPQNLISRGIRIIDDFSMPMIANKFPSGRIIEGRIAQLLHRTPVGVFDHADIIDQHFAVGKQSHIELAPLIVRPTTTRCPLSISVSLPLRSAGLIARCPRHCIAVVCIQIA